jgi:hypothetical protein
MDPFELYESFRSMNNTHQAGFFRPVRDFIPAVHTISMAIFVKLIEHLEKGSRITDMLLPFYRSLNVAIEKRNQIEVAPYPPDYSAFSSAKILLQQENVCVDKRCQAFKDGQFLSPEEMEDFFPVVTTYDIIDVTDVPDSKFGSASIHETKRPTLNNL